MSARDVLPRTFMFTSFATAILLVAVQLQNISSSTASNRPQKQAASSKELNRAIQAALPAGFNQASSGSSEVSPAANSARLLVDLSDRQVSLYLNDVLQASYRIAIGKAGWETPTGSFNVLNMQVNPVWRHPFTGKIVPAGPDNPLGSRWIGFWTDGKNGIGFHGTNETALLGQAVSHGCIRMRNEDIQFVYTQVAIGTPVIVRP